MSPSARARRWVVAGGGTGGHVTPALALGERIVARGDEVLFLGSTRGLETRLVPAAGFRLVTLEAQPFQGRSRTERARVWLGLPRLILTARRALRDFGAEIVVSVGGYAAVAPALAAATLRLPLALVNTDATPGLANRVAGRFAARVFVGFETAARVFARGDVPGRVQVPGIPLRQALLDAFAGAPARRMPAPPLRLLIFGGSQGARQLNDAVLAALPQLDLAKVEFFHQTGEADRARVAEGYEAAGARATVSAFEPDMPGRYRWADLALCRAGAMTVAELTLAGLPALLVPYPHAANDEQAANAAALAAAGAARLLPSREFDANMLVRELGALLANPPLLRAMGEHATKLARPRAAEDIVEECATLLAD